LHTCRQVFLKHGFKAVYLFGSQVYQNTSPKSDFDFIVIGDGNLEDLKAVLPENSDISVYSEEQFIDAVEKHHLDALECLCSRPIYSELSIEFSINLDRLRRDISSRCSNSWVKCKKKLNPTNNSYDPYRAKKSAWHSLRMLMFGIQLARFGKIVDFTEANQYYDEVMKCETWSDVRESLEDTLKYYRHIFRIHAPKEEK
jgi:predicted nucleotidyltransferase